MSKPHAQALDLRLYFVTDPQLCGERGVIETARAAAVGGAGIVQLRDKLASPAERRAVAEGLKAALAGTGAALIINDDVDLALAIGADGVHLGQEDGGWERARALLGQEALLGISVNTPAHAAAINPALIDYAGIGPVHATTTKGDHKTPLGISGAAALCASVPVPCVAIGGVDEADAAALAAGGFDGIAVVSALACAPDPQAKAAALRRAFDAGLTKRGRG
ncbi:MAG: thiamine phosphate synthase [Neomegalonema sp.]|nr:thiamine phosphate synthase [Neomegalonema sp.]